jgi:hypothetical protein
MRHLVWSIYAVLFGVLKKYAHLDYGVIYLTTMNVDMCDVY